VTESKGVHMQCSISSGCVCAAESTWARLGGEVCTSPAVSGRLVKWHDRPNITVWHGRRWSRHGCMLSLCHDVPEKPVVLTDHSDQWLCWNRGQRGSC